MDARTVDEPGRLERFAGQLRSLQAHCHATDRGVGALCGTLLRMLDLRLVFARIRSAVGSLHRDIVSIEHRYSDRVDLPALTAALEPWLARSPEATPTLQYLPVGPDVLSITVLEFGSGSTASTLVVAAARPNFPDELERLLLQAAADQVSVALLHDVGLIEAGDLTAVIDQVLAAIVQNCSDFIGIATLAGHAVFVNSAGRRMVGLEDDEPLPPDISAYVADGYQDLLVNRSLAVVEREGFWDGETCFRHFRTGATIPVLQHIFYIREESTGRRLALATVTRDISERKRAELALDKAQQELAHAGRVLSMGELTASLAHEINQPLAAIVANANASRRWLERKTPNHQRARESLANIARDGMRASDIIRRVRAFSAKGLPARASLDINDVIREVVALTIHEVEREHVVLTTQLAADLPPVRADRVELQQVVLNLVINSIEALRPVAERTRELCIATARHNKSTVLVSVRDNGAGIEPQHLERIFDAFFTTKSLGMGLGLAISRRIVETHNGALWATPNPDRGLTVAFTLPVARRRSR
jgi:PAS domain S-box-containing protein